MNHYFTQPHNISKFATYSVFQRYAVMETGELSQVADAGQAVTNTTALITESPPRPSTVPTPSSSSPSVVEEPHGTALSSNGIGVFFDGAFIEGKIARLVRMALHHHLSSPGITAHPVMACHQALLLIGTPPMKSVTNKLSAKSLAKTCILT